MNYTVRPPDNPPASKWVLIVSNRLAGARHGTEEIAKLGELLTNRGLRVRNIERLEELSDAVPPLLEAGELHAVVCAGGDGTIAAVLNCTPPQTPLAILPRGTENLLAKYTQQPFDPGGVSELILRGETVNLDVGRAGERLFLLMLSAGIDADVVRRMAEQRSGHITHWSWAKPIWQAVRSYQYPKLRIYCRNDISAKMEQETELDARWAFVVNLPRYARGLQWAPNAVGTDGQLDLCAFRKGSLAAGIRYLFHSWLGQYDRIPDCHRLRARSFRLEADQPVPFQMDGDHGGWLPVEIETMPGRLRLFVPQEFAAQTQLADDDSQATTA